MWAQLALAGVKSLADEQNRKRDIASNVITQKYSPWTGARADFSSIGKNSTISNMMAGFGAGMAQDQADERLQMMKDYFKKPTEAQSDADYYAKLSKDPASVGVTSVPGKSAFANAPVTQPQASRSPAVMPGAGAERPVFDLQSAVNPYQDPTPFMLQGQVPVGESPWLTLAKSQLIEGKNTPAKAGPTGLNDSVWSRR